MVQASPVEIRRRIGMVFQRPNPFPDHVDLRQRGDGFTLNGIHKRKRLDEVVERSLQRPRCGRK